MEEFKQKNGGYKGYIKITQVFLNKAVPKTAFKNFALDKEGNQKKWKDCSRLSQVGNEIIMQCGFFDEFGNREGIVEHDEFKLFYDYFSGLIISKDDFEKLEEQLQEQL
jgi:hypothetical protein